MSRKHVIKLQDESGNIRSYPLRQWMRDHPKYLPDGRNVQDYNSYQLHGFLKKHGWVVDLESSSVEVQIVAPDLMSSGFELADGVRDHIEEVETENEIDELSFELEFQLRDFIVTNLSGIDLGGRRLVLFQDDVGRDGREYPTEVGPIDILATDGVDDLFAFELKRATAPDRAVGQLTRYMGALKIKFPSKNIHGVIVAKNIDKKLVLAASVIPNVFLFEYSIEFSVAPVSTG